MNTAATDRLVRMPEVIARTSLSRSTIYRRMQRGEFPHCIPIGANSVAWRDSDIVRWLASPMFWEPTATLLETAGASGLRPATPGDRDALDALNHRLGHTAAIARLLREHINGDVPADLVDAIGGIACTLEEVATSVDAILHKIGAA